LAAQRRNAARLAFTQPAVFPGWQMSNAVSACSCAAFTIASISISSFLALIRWPRGLILMAVPCQS
jgi:hypothetical protein